MIRVLCFMILLAAGVGAAGADQYWIAYEGNDFPENEGWERYTRAGGAERSLVDGMFALDGRSSIDIVDDYWMDAPLEPGPGGFFVMQWRLRVDEVQGHTDPSVLVTCYPHGEVLLLYREDAVYSVLESAWIEFAPGVFHDYSFTSSDLLTYALHIDGQLAHVGQFVGHGNSSGVGWGDANSGASSLSVWDHVRFGIVPEPHSGLLLAFVGLAALAKRTPRRRRNRDEIL